MQSLKLPHGQPSALSEIVPTETLLNVNQLANE